MTEERYLILSSWLVSRRPLLELTESIAAFLARETGWRAPYGQDPHVQVQELYYLTNTRAPDGTPPWGKPLAYRSGGNKKARRQIAEREVGTIQAGFPARWRDPYVRSPPIYHNYGSGVDLLIQQDPGEPTFYLVQIRFYDTALWFAPPSIAEVIYDAYDFVRKYRQELGYELNKGPRFHRFDGQEYLPADELSRENRERVLLGLAAYLHRYSPEGAILTYRLPGNYDRRRKIMSYPEKTGAVAPLYFTGPGISIAPRSLELYDATYFAGDVQGVTLYLEEEHFGFLHSL